MKKVLSDVLRRAGDYFMGRSPIHEAAERLQGALEELGIPFAVAGALAANAHGHVRTTEDVDILITPEGLKLFKERCLGRGWVEKFPGSRGLRDTRTGVDIDVLLTGEYPGDGLPKPVAFPHPDQAAITDAEGRPILSLPVLIELKLASGMTAPHRLQDLADVLRLIRVNSLPAEYAEQLSPYVRQRFGELWAAAQHEDPR